MTSTLRNSQTKLLVAGYGVVGRAVYETLNQNLKFDMYIDDPAKGFEINEDKVFPDAIVIAVATPSLNDGGCDVSAAECIFEKYGKTPKYLVKSAIDPLWLSYKKKEGYNITYSPEFLKGSTAENPIVDFINSELAIYGGGAMRWWHEQFAPYMHNLKTVRFVSLEQAAFAKYVENCFLATKVTFFNEMYRIYQNIGFEDFDVMVEAICNDSRIGYSHTQVPGPDGKYGYGGHCFPKDVAALAALGRANGADTYLLEAIQTANKVYRYEDPISKS